MKWMGKLAFGQPAPITPLCILISRALPAALSVSIESLPPLTDVATKAQ